MRSRSRAGMPTPWSTTVRRTVSLVVGLGDVPADGGASSSSSSLPPLPGPVEPGDAIRPVRPTADGRSSSAAAGPGPGGPATVAGVAWVAGVAGVAGPGGPADVVPWASTGCCTMRATWVPTRTTAAISWGAPAPPAASSWRCPSVPAADGVAITADATGARPTGPAEVLTGTGPRCAPG